MLLAASSDVVVHNTTEPVVVCLKNRVKLEWKKVALLTTREIKDKGNQRRNRIDKRIYVKVLLCHVPYNDLCSLFGFHFVFMHS